MFCYCVISSVGNKVDLTEQLSGSGKDRTREVSTEEAVEFAKQENMDFFETSALTGRWVDHMFRRITLSVAKSMPEIAVHLEVSFIPEGWTVAEVDNSNGNSNETTPTGTPSSQDVGVLSRLSVSDINATLIDSKPKLRAKSNASRPSSSDLPLTEVKKKRYTNYWTGVSVLERPTQPAANSPGLLYALVPVVGKQFDRTNNPMERTSSCRTTATAVSNSSNSSAGYSHNDANADFNGLSEGRRSMSRSNSSSTKTNNCLNNLFRCVRCTIS